jgi:Caspase domain
MRAFRRLGLTTAALALLTLVATHAVRAAGPQKVALVIGNSHYDHADAISGEQDAFQMADYLTQLGFEVIGGRELVIDGKPLHDAKREGILAGLAALSERAADAVTVVVFYSGHGFQINGKNFLVPTDHLTISTSTLLPEEPIPFYEVLNALSYAEKATGKLVILDACRENATLPVGDTQLGKLPGWLAGLAKPDSDEGVAFAFATPSGRTAPANEPDQLSPYSEALLRDIREPGLEIRELLKRVKDRLSGRQAPTEQNLPALPREFFLSDPIYLEAQIEYADDDLMVLLNGQKVLSWGDDKSAIRRLRLRADRPNELLLNASNDRTHRFGKAWERTEGWKYKLTLRREGAGALPSFQENTQVFEACEDIPFKDGPHHYNEPFLAQRAVLNVSTKRIGEVTWGERQLDLWNRQAAFFARDQDSLWERSFAQLPGIKLIAALLGVTGAVDPAKQFVAVRGNVALRPAVESCMQGKRLVKELEAGITTFDDRLSKCVADHFKAPDNSQVKVWTSIDDRSRDNPARQCPVAQFRTLGAMHGAAGACKPAYRAHQTLALTLPPGLTADPTYQQEPLPCCGGRENTNGSHISIPAGLQVKLDGGDQGEWGAFNLRLLPDPRQVDTAGKSRGWTVEADLYCGPSCKLGSGGCNVNLTAALATNRE